MQQESKKAQIIRDGFSMFHGPHDIPEGFPTAKATDDDLMAFYRENRELLRGPIIDAWNKEYKEQVEKREFENIPQEDRDFYAEVFRGIGRGKIPNF